ncbi:MAG TPA: septum formation initiator family protein [Gemmatirosa sp.]|nr:septum formation initiator family protein [Gemmatirosa sp.]
MSLVQRAVWAAVAVGAVAFAVQGGEYGTTDLLAQRERLRALKAEVDSLQTQVDSLRVVERRLRDDPALQERVAREEFGMVRGDRELLFRLVDPKRAPPTDASSPRADSTRSGG